jgi:vacuolar protein sorting-associated protein 8
MSTSLNDLQTLDLDDLDDDLLQIEKDFDLTAFSNATSINGNNETPTLESILNEDDDEEADEVLKSLTSTLTTMERLVSATVQETENSSRRDSHEQKVSRSRTTSSLNQMLTERNGIVCKQAMLKQISNQVVVAIERSDAGLPTVLAIGVNTIAVGTSRGLVLIFDSLQALKLYITNDYKDAITAISLNNKCDRLLVGNALGYIFMFDQHGKF